MKKRVLSIALAATMIAALFAGCAKKNTVEDLSALNGTYDITVWVSESDGVTDLTQKQIAAFCEAHPGITINAQIEGVSESNSASNMITDVESGADLYCFAQDQLSRLVEAGALAKLGDATAATIKEINDATSVKAASVGNVLYCYPMTSDNGYFMMYDKSVVKEEHLDSLEDIIADCEAAGKLFSMECETSAWYTAAFFFGTGCTSEWTTDPEGKVTGVSDNFNSDAGLIAMKGMEKLVKSPSFNSSSKGADFAAAVPAAVVVTGVWEFNAAKEALGDNYGVTDLPSFTVDGKSYHMGSYSGCKLMGVKPQTDANKAALLQKLAMYLTNAENQVQRYDLVGWGPSNKEAQSNDNIKADPNLVALAAQNEYAIPQGNIHGKWWDTAKTLGTSAKNAASEDDLKKALEQYEVDINAFFDVSEDEANAWSMIGAFSGYNWDTDVPMVKGDDGVWTAEQAFEADEQVKFRMGGGWDVNCGYDAIENPSDDYEGNADGNVVIKTAGTYAITLTYDGETAVVTFELQ